MANPWKKTMQQKLEDRVDSMSRCQKIMQKELTEKVEPKLFKITPA